VATGPKRVEPRRSGLAVVIYAVAELSVGPISSTQPTKRLTQPNPAHRKVKTLDPQTNPTHNPIELHTTKSANLRAHGKQFNISQSVKVYQVLLIYQYLSLSGYQVLLYQSQKAYKVLKFVEMFLTQPNPPKS